MTSPDPTPAAEYARLGSDERKTVRRCLVVLAALSAASLTGTASSLWLVNHAPLLLVALSPIGRHLVLVAPTVDPAAFVAVAVGRRMVAYVTCFQLGRALGPVAIPWLEARAARFARFVRWIERIFAKAPRAVVFAMTGPTVSGLAGMSGMRQAVFASLAGVGLTLRMLAVLAFAEWLREPILVLLDWIDRYWVPGTLVLVAAIALHQWRRRARIAALRREVLAGPPPGSPSRDM